MNCYPVNCSRGCFPCQTSSQCCRQGWYNNRAKETHRPLERELVSPARKWAQTRQQEENQRAIESNQINGVLQRDVHMNQRTGENAQFFHDSWQKKLRAQLAKKLKYFPRDIKKNMTDHLILTTLWYWVTLLEFKTWQGNLLKITNKYSQKTSQRGCYVKSQFDLAASIWQWQQERKIGWGGGVQWIICYNELSSQVSLVFSDSAAYWAAMFFKCRNEQVNSEVYHSVCTLAMSNSSKTPRPDLNTSALVA